MPRLHSYALAIAVVGCGATDPATDSGDGAAARRDGAPTDVGLNAIPSSGPELDAGDGDDSRDGACLSIGASWGDTTDASKPQTIGTCQNGWMRSDPGCPCSLTGFLTYCTQPGMRCVMPGADDPTLVFDQLCVSEPNAVMPLWEQTALYTPETFAALPHSIDLDASDCAERPVIPCVCGDDGATEGFLGEDESLWHCTYSNPEAYVAFTDAGCATQIRYAGEFAPAAGYSACLQAAYASRRWACASDATHLVMSRTSPPLRPK
jgi:hypothetical protein